MYTDDSEASVDLNDEDELLRMFDESPRKSSSASSASSHTSPRKSSHTSPRKSSHTSPRKSSQRSSGRTTPTEAMLGRRSRSLDDGNDLFADVAPGVNDVSESAESAESSTESSTESVSERAPESVSDDLFADVEEPAPEPPAPAPEPPAPEQQLVPPVASATQGPTIASRAADLVRTTRDRICMGFATANQVDADLATEVGRVAKVGHGYTVTFFALKLFLLACLVGYTANLDESCPCADDARKSVLLWGGGFVMGLCVVAIFVPDVYTRYPALKAVLMTLTLLVLYSVLTYFPLLRQRGCECAPEDWRRWVVEGGTYLVLAVFVLSVLGVVVV
jgi:hypothetical protein